VEIRKSHKLKKVPSEKVPFLVYLCTVKKILKIAALLPLIILCCSLSGAIRTTASGGNKVVSISSAEDLHSSVGAFYLSHPSTLSGNFVRVFNPPIFSQKNRLPSTWGFRKLAELILLNSYSNYQFFSKNIIGIFSPTPIIFPSHYFW